MTAYTGVSGKVMDFTGLALRASQYQDGSGNEIAFTPTTSSTTDNAISRFDGTSGALQNSVVTIADTTGNIAGVTYYLRSVGNALTAVGTNRATALQLAKEVNNVTTAAASTGVLLPVGIIGMRVTIFNAGANAIQVYATASETIDTVAGSTGVVLTNTKRADYFFTAANTWISAQLGVVSA